MDQAQSSSNSGLGAQYGAMDDKSKSTISEWVGDMVALESHIEEALDHQLAMKNDNPQAKAAIQRFHDRTKANRDRLKAYQEQVGSTGGNPVKAVGATILGKAAGIIDKIRAEGVSKSLRDDYTAFNHACIGYTMLHATAVSLGDQRTADVAAQGMRHHAMCVQEINHLIGEVVVWELGNDDHQIVNRQAGDQNRKKVDEIWKETA